MEAFKMFGIFGIFLSLEVIFLRTCNFTGDRVGRWRPLYRVTGWVK